MKFAAILLTFALFHQQQKPEPDVKNEKYGPDERNVLDFWKAKSDKPTPLVIFIHGGGFRTGSKDAVAGPLITACRDAGISVASINYRLSQTAPFPAPMHDGARAVQYLRSKAKEFNINPDRIACTGGSAGAGISLWLAFHDDLANPKAEDPVLRHSTRISCALSTAGQCSYDPRFIKKHIGGRAHEHAALPPFWGLKPEEMETEKAYKIFDECSPIHHLTKDDPPAMMIYGGKDEPGEKPGAGIHSEKFGIVLREEMKKLGLTCEFKTGRFSEKDQVDFFAKWLNK